MGRKSKLSEKQWEQIGKRLLAGEKGRALAKEFDVSESAIRARFSAQVEKIKYVANQIVATETALSELPVSAQIAAHNYADQLRAISSHLLGAANYSAATTHRLSAIANAEVQKVDDADPSSEVSEKALKNVGRLTRLANDASTVPINLLAANKEVTKNVVKDDPVLPVKVVVQVEDASVPET